MILRGQRGLVGNGMIFIGITFHCVACLRARTRGVGVWFVIEGRAGVMVSKARICGRLSFIFFRYLIV